MNIKLFFKTLVYLCLALVIISVLLVSGLYIYGKIMANTLPENTNVVILGSDEGGQRTDVMMLAQYQRLEGKISILQIPRDTYTNFKRGDFKINSAWGAGKQNQVFKEVESVTKIKSEEYVYVTFEAFRKLIDAIGGVDFYVPMDMNYDDDIQGLNIHLKEGMQHLDGKKAEQFVRYRNDNGYKRGYSEGDVGRLKAQQDFLGAVAKKLLSPQNIIKIPYFIKIISENVETSFSSSEIIKYLVSISGIRADDITVELLPGSPKMIGGGSYYLHDPKKVKEITEKLFK